MDVMVELGLHLGRRAFPVDGRMIFTTDICVYESVLAGVQKKGPARKREDKGKLNERNCPMMEVEE